MLFESALILSRISLKVDMALQYRQLAVLVASGIPPVEALQSLIDDCRNSKAGKVLGNLKQDLEHISQEEDKTSGKSPFYNPGLLYLLSRSTTPEETAIFLNSLADELENSAAVYAKIRAAAVYPLMVLLVAVICTGIIMVFVIPVFSEMFSGFNAHLPAPTQFVINLSEFLTGNLIYLVCAVVAAVLGICFFRHQLVLILSGIPVLNWLARKKATFQFCRYFSIIAPAGLPVKNAILFSSFAVDNPYFKKKLMNMGRSFEEHKDLKSVMSQTGLFPGMIIQAASVGEKSGALHTVFRHVAQYQEKQIHSELNRYTHFFDIFCIVLIGGVIGGIVVAMYLPIFSMAGVVS